MFIFQVITGYFPFFLSTVTKMGFFIFDHTVAPDQLFTGPLYLLQLVCRFLGEMVKYTFFSVVFHLICNNLFILIQPMIEMDIVNY